MECLEYFLVYHRHIVNIWWFTVLILQNSAFFTVQLSHPYMTIGKTIALTRRTFIGKVISLLFNILSRLVITFLPRNKCLLISWLQSPSAVILDYSLFIYSIFGISQARILECIAICSFKGSSWPRDQSHVSCIGRWFVAVVVVLPMSHQGSLTPIFLLCFYAAFGTV